MKKLIFKLSLIFTLYYNNVNAQTNLVSISQWNELITQNKTITVGANLNLNYAYVDSLNSTFSIFAIGGFGHTFDINNNVVINSLQLGIGTGIKFSQNYPEIGLGIGHDFLQNITFPMINLNVTITKL